MKFIMHIFPIVIFFIYYHQYDIFIASKYLILSSILSLIIQIIFYHKIEKNYLLSFIFILIFSSLTIFFHNSQFIKLKTTIIYIFFSIILFINKFLIKKIFAKKFLEQNIIIADLYWKKINLYWAIFFLLCSLLNMYISFYLSEIFWVNFKIFGFTTIIFLSFFVTIIYIYKKNTIRKE
ncbi:septation protein IspZ [Buchnera aphidicola]|uniref:septation protein IspZ n=1 Tax=Buchnera aphidicola TaxID=9 RepID=UPI0034648F48